MNLKRIFFLIGTCLVIGNLLLAQSSLEILFFHSPHCGACLYVKEKVLPKIKDKYKDKIKIIYLSTDKKENLEKLISLSSFYGQDKPLVPTILCGDKLLVGRDSIRKNLAPLIGKLVGRRGVPSSLKIMEDAFRQGLVEEKFRRFSIAAVVTGGLLDGINPCAFAVIVFFISLLSCYGYRKRELIWIGIFYILAIFIAYLLIGLGIFNFLYSLKYFYLAMKIFYLFMGIFCFILGVFCLYDYFRFYKTKQPQESVLQLPKFLKLRIHKLIGDEFKTRTNKNFIILGISSFVVGFLVSLLEALCTGQIYLPVISIVVKTSQLRIKALSYLILYNLMFILPLVIIFLLALWGLTSLEFSNFLRRNFGAIRIAMAILFLGLAGFLLGSVWF